MTLSPSTLRLDLKCGKGAISEGEKCHKGAARKAPSALTAGAIGLGVGATALGVGLLAMGKGRAPRSTSRSAGGPGPTPSPTTPSPRPSGPPRLPGSSPRGLLNPAPPRKSKTQRMRENTQAAMRAAEGRIAQTAREEVRRLAQVGNTMAATGEATGMAFKTTLRELRLRTEAARRRFEPGYRTPEPPTPKAPAQLPEGGSAFQVPFSAPTPITPEAIRINPRTGQPRRRKPRGFGRSTGDSSVTFYSTTYVDPARQ